MRVFDVEANLVSGAIVAPALRLGGLSIAPRLWGTFGRVKGSMTCSTQTMLGHGSDLELYYATVCHGRESDDCHDGIYCHTNQCRGIRRASS